MSGSGPNSAFIKKESLMTKIRIGIAIGGALALAACVRLLWLMIGDKSWGWSAGAAIYMAFLIAALIGMWQGRTGALRLSRVLAVVLFGFGCWAANFAWTFWLFEEPTLRDRILAVVHPQISIYWAGPVIWFLLSALPRIREQFRK